MSPPRSFVVGARAIGPDEPVFLIAEISANHGGSLDRAKRLISAAADAGADAVKLQTYTPDTMTLDIDADRFRVGPGTVWEGRKLYDLYAEAMTPWEWHEELSRVAESAGLLWFSSPFDASAVDFLESLNVPAFKIASFEVVDLPLIAKAGSMGKPLVISTGMSSAAEIDAAVATAFEAGASGVALMRCNSAYPASPSEMDLLTIPDMANRWEVPIGLSDHTTDATAAVVAVALGACLVEKHIILARSDGGPDAGFSAEPDEFAHLARSLRDARAAVGRVRYGPSASEAPSLAFRRSLWVVQAVEAGEHFTAANVKALRPADGLPPGELARVRGSRAARSIEAGTPLTEDLLA